MSALRLLIALTGDGEFWPCGTALPGHLPAI